MAWPLVSPSVWEAQLGGDPWRAGLSHPVGSGGAAGVESVPTGLQVQQVEAELPRVPVDHLHA